MKEAFNPGDLVCLQNLTQPIMTVKGITQNGKGETFIVCSWFLNVNIWKKILYQILY